MGMGVKYLPMVLNDIKSNVPVTAKSFPFRRGHFGKRYGHSSSYEISSENPQKTALSFFSKLTSGGSVTKITTGTGWGYRAHMGDNSIVMLRMHTSVVGSPAIDINVESSFTKGRTIVRSHKIHFIKS